MTGSAELAPGAARPRVGYVVRSWPRLSQTFIVQEIRALERRGVDVEVFSLSRSHEALVQPELASIAAPVVFLDRPASLLGRFADLGRIAALAVTKPGLVVEVMQARGWDRGYHAASRFVLLRQADQLARHVRRGRRSGRRLGHLHAHFAHDPAAVASLTSILTGLPFSFTAHARDIYQVEPSTLAERLSSAAAVVTICRSNLAYLEEHCPPHRRPLLHLVHNGVDLADFPVAERRPAQSGPLRIVSIARLVEKKGLEDLVAACAGLRALGVSFTCRVFGEGPLQASLSTMIAAAGLGDAVTLEGPRTRRELIEVLAGSDVFALLPYVTSDGDRDGIPTVLVEAMACSTTVVTTSVAGIPDLVTDGINGVMLAPRDVAGATNALARLALAPDERVRLGAAGRRTVEEDFDGDRSAAMLDAVFRGRASDVDDVDRAGAPR